MIFGGDMVDPQIEVFIGCLGIRYMFIRLNDGMRFKDLTTLNGAMFGKPRRKFKATVIVLYYIYSRHDTTLTFICSNQGLVIIQVMYGRLFSVQRWWFKATLDGVLVPAPTSLSMVNYGRRKVKYLGYKSG